MMKSSWILFFVVMTCWLCLSCGASSDHLSLVHPYMEKIETLQSEKESIYLKDELSEIDRARLEYIDSEIERVTQEVNEVSRRYGEAHLEEYETSNFYKNERSKRNDYSGESAY
mgnify:CR=1 FL=1